MFPYIISSPSQASPTQNIYSNYSNSISMKTRRKTIIRQELLVQYGCLETRGLNFLHRHYYHIPFSLDCVVCLLWGVDAGRRQQSVVCKTMHRQEGARCGDVAASWSAPAPFAFLTPPLFSNTWYFLVADFTLISRTGLISEIWGEIESRMKSLYLEKSERDGFEP